MSMGIEIDVCREMNCKYRSERRKGGCKLIKCKNQNAYNHYLCPIPDKCPYNPIHILMGKEIAYCDMCKEFKCK